MNGLAVMSFVSEITLQVKIAQRAAERLQAANDNFDHIEIWGAIQSILGATANVSKILWPNKQKERGEELRKMLGVSKNNLHDALLFRNHFDHYDDRLEQWFKVQEQGVFIDRVMNPSLQSFDFCHRGYNSTDNTLVFRNEILDLNLVLQELETLLEKCRQFGITF
jgi:hypothetical protein